MRTTISIVLLVILGVAFGASSTYNFDFKVCKLQVVTGGVPSSAIQATASKDSQGVVKSSTPQDFLEVTCLPLPIESEKYQLKMNVFCYSEGSSVQEHNFTANRGVNANGVNVVSVEGYSRYGCIGHQMPELMKWIQISEEILSFVIHIALITIGVFFLFLGLKMFNLALFAVVATFGTFLAFEIVKTNNNFQCVQQHMGEPSVVLGVWAFSAICGIFVGYVTLKLRKLGYFVGGFAVGAVFWYGASELAMTAFEIPKPNELHLLIAVSVASLIVGWIVMKIVDPIAIVITSIAGALLIICGFLSDMTPLVALGVTFALIILGVFAQFKLNFKAAKQVLKKEAPKKAEKKSNTNKKVKKE